MGIGSKASKGLAAGLAIALGGGGGGTSDYSALTNKPKINNKELVGNKSNTDLDIALVIEAESHRTVEGFDVPELTNEQITQAYNAIVAGKQVIIIDDLGTIAISVIDGSIITSNISIRLLFKDKLLLTYTLDETSAEEIGSITGVRIVIKDGQAFMIDTDGSGNVLIDGATIELDVDGNLQLGEIVGKVRHIGEVDLNTITNTGFYFCNVCTNRPINSNGILIVGRQNDATTYVMQEYFAFTNNKVFVRFRNNNVWSDWQEITNQEILVDIGSNQFIYDGYSLPAIAKTDLDTIYQNKKEGKPQYLKWSVLGTELYFTVVSADKIASNYSIDILVHNKYHCSYTWQDGTTGLVNPEVEKGATANPYLSLERLGPYLSRITYDNLQEYVEDDTLSEYFRGCTTFVRDGKTYRSFDLMYNNVMEFIVKTKDFDGIAIIQGIDDGNIETNKDKLGQLPYHLSDGCNRDGIIVSEHVLFNDFGFDGTGTKTNDLTKLPTVILQNVKSMGELTSNVVVNTFLANCKLPTSLTTLGYALHYLITDNTTTYTLTPKDDGSGYEFKDISSLPKITNFKHIDKARILERNDTLLQDRPTGIERWNLIEDGATLQDLRFTLAYESTDRLSEFIGEDGTTKESTDAELEAIYITERAKYLSRTRDGQTWQSVHSVIYSNSGIEVLFVQEDYNKNYIIVGEREITKADFELLPQEIKDNGTTYYITDDGGSITPIDTNKGLAISDGKLGVKVDEETVDFDADGKLKVIGGGGGGNIIMVDFSSIIESTAALYGIPLETMDIINNAIDNKKIVVIYYNNENTEYQPGFFIFGAKNYGYYQPGVTTYTFGSFYPNGEGKFSKLLIHYDGTYYEGEIL